MTSDMHQDRELYASELKNMLKEALQNAIEGEFSAHPGDPYFYTQKAYSMQTEIEGLPLYPQEIPDVLLNWAKLDKEKTRRKEDILVLDLETTGLGRTGTLAFMIGLGYYENNQFIVEQLFLPDPEAEVSSFDRLLELVKSRSLLITFNGKTFDVPVLESRLLYHQIWLNLREMEHLDLLHIARRLWRNKLPSCALETIEFYVLGHIRDKELDIEGGDIPQTYYQFLLSGDPELIRRVFIHNHHDILHTAALFTLIADSIAYPPAHGFDIRIDYHALARLYQSQGEEETSRRILVDLMAAGVVTADVMRDLGLIYKKAKELDSALECFQIASDLNCPDSMLELCMLLEKNNKEYAKALACAEKLKNWHLSRYIVNSKRIAELDKRMERLKRLTERR